jgi:phage tail sheath protein FI
MTERLSPGVYVEETPVGSRSVEGVPTHTFGLAGLTEYGPVTVPATAQLPTGSAAPGRLPTGASEPVLVTSFEEYQRAFGGLTIAGRPCLVAHAARAFFVNGGRRLFVTRVFAPTVGVGGTSADGSVSFGSLPVPAQEPLLCWRARWPGSVAGRIRVAVALRRGENALLAGVLSGLQPGGMVEVVNPADLAGAGIPDEADPVPGNVRIVTRGADGVLGYLTSTGGFELVDPATVVLPLTFTVTVSCGDRVDVYDGLQLDPRRAAPRHPRSVLDVLRLSEPPDEHGLVWLDLVDPASGPDPSPGDLAAALLTLRGGAFLTGGDDGGPLTSDVLRGNHSDAGSGEPARGLGALAGNDEIAVVATPDAVLLPDADRTKAVEHLVAHCEQDRHRIALVDPPPDGSIEEVLRFRAQVDSSYAALYYPWLRVVDPTGGPLRGVSPRLLDLPPSGAVAGIYARNDLQRGVHKAPANEVVHGVAGFTVGLTRGEQEVLSAEGVNVLRSFEGRGHRVWGARTLSTDPEWRYVSVRRLFLYLEHSVARSTQWVLFEPNGEPLWAVVRRTVEDFLLRVWSSGALPGEKPEEAFFVRCDRTTMTQSDLDDGRLICLIGVAPMRPAEFMVFRVAHRTADAQHG